MYCGFPLDGGRKRVCSEHADLPALDDDFVSMSDLEIQAWAEETIADMTLRRVREIKMWALGDPL